MKLNVSKHMQKRYSQFFQTVEEKIDILYSYDRNSKSTCHSNLNTLDVYTYSDYPQEKRKHPNNFYTILNHSELSIWKEYKETIKFIDLDKNKLIGIHLFRLVRNFTLAKRKFSEIQMMLLTPNMPESKKKRLLTEHEQYVNKLNRQRMHINYIFRRQKLLLEYIIYLLNIGVCEEDLFRPYHESLW